MKECGRKTFVLVSAIAVVWGVAMCASDHCARGEGSCAKSSCETGVWFCVGKAKYTIEGNSYAATVAKPDLQDTTPSKYTYPAGSVSATRTVHEMHYCYCANDPLCDKPCLTGKRSIKKSDPPEQAKNWPNECKASGS